MKTITIRIILTYIPAALFLSLSFFHCNKTGSDDSGLTTLKDQIQGKTYILGTVMQGGTNVTSEFTGFKIAFNADGTACTIQSPSKPCLSTFSAVSVAEQTISIIINPGNCLGSTLSNVSSNTDGTVLNFDAVITFPTTTIVVEPVGGRTGSSETNLYTFNLIKQ